ADPEFLEPAVEMVTAAGRRGQRHRAGGRVQAGRLRRYQLARDLEAELAVGEGHAKPGPRLPPERLPGHQAHLADADRGHAAGVDAQLKLPAGEPYLPPPPGR